MVETESKPTGTTTCSKPSEPLTCVCLKDYGYIPLLLANAAYVIEKNIRTPALFQTTGDASKVFHNLLIGPRNKKLKSADVHDVVSAMKIFLASLTPLPEDVCDALISASQKDCVSQYVFVLREFRNVSPYNFAVLHFVMSQLKKVSEYSSHNGADVRMLATTFVFDVIKPLNEDVLNDGLYLSERVQRLPFLITVVENLIQNVIVFKMACALNNAVAPDTEIEQRQNNEESQTAGKDMIAEHVTNSVDWSSRHAVVTGPQKKQSYELCTSTTLASTSNVDFKVSASSREVIRRSTNCISAEGNNLQLKDVLGPEGGTQSNNILSTDVPVRESSGSKNTFRAVEKITCSTSQRNGVKTDTMNTSPDKKPSRFLHTKKSRSTMRKKKKKSHCTESKLNTEQENEQFSVWSQCSDLMTFQLPEDITPWENGSSDTEEDASVMTKTIRNPRLLDVKTSDQKNQKDLVIHKSMNRQNTLEMSQTLLAGNGLRADSHEDRLTLIPNISDTAMTSTNVAMSCRMRIVLNTPGETSEVPEIRGTSSGHEGPPSNETRKLEPINSNGANSGRSFNISLTSSQNKDIELTIERHHIKASAFATFSACTQGQNRTPLLNTSARSESIKDSQQPDVAEYDKDIREMTRPSVTGCDNITDSAQPLVAECNSVRPIVSGCDSARDSIRLHFSGYGNIRNSMRSSISRCDNNTRKSPRNSEAHVKAADSTASTQKVSHVRTMRQVSASAPSRCNDGFQTSGDLHQRIFVKIKNERPRTRGRFDQCQNRMESSVVAQQRQNFTLSLTSFGKWLVHIFLVCMILFCISLLLNNIHYSKTEDDPYK